MAKMIYCNQRTAGNFGERKAESYCDLEEYFAVIMWEYSTLDMKTH